MNKKQTLGIIGVRGYVGKELLGLIAMDKNIQVEWVSSRQLKNQSVSQLVEQDVNFSFRELPDDHYYHDLMIDNISVDEIKNKAVDIIVLALPNGLAEPFVKVIESLNLCKVLIDLSADYRFSDDWVYSVPEINDTALLNKNINDSLIKISNPGCYATAMQVAIAPLVPYINGTAHCFGVSGYSGAGTKPSANNDPENLKNNLLPYALLEHLHEKEVSYHLELPISFSPHVAAFFRGISMTVQIELTQPLSENEVMKTFEAYYQNKPLIKVTSAIPNIQQVVHTHECLVGGFKISEDGKRLTLVSCLDNLLKGAASQALQNIELALYY